MNLIISSYACDPYKGTEDGKGWNYVYAASRKHNVIVLTDKKNKDNIEKFILEKKIDNKKLEFFYISTPQEKNILLNGRIKYILWQRQAAIKAKEITQTNKIDYLHHITWASCVLPIQLYKVGVPIIYGPVGGGERLPKCIHYKMSFVDIITEWMRVSLQNISKYFSDNKKTLEKAKIILVTTEETKMIIPQKYHKKTVIMQAIGMNSENIISELPDKKVTDTFNIVMAGRFLFWKGFDIGIASIKKLIDDGEDVSLTIVGSGRKMKYLRKLVKGYENRIKLLGKLPHKEMNTVYDNADALLNCSLHDSGCIVVLEAMSRGIPVVCINTGGPKVLTTDDCALRIEPKPYEQLVSSIGKAVLELKNDSNLRKTLISNALSRVKSEFLYEKQYNDIFQCIKDIEAN